MEAKRCWIRLKEVLLSIDPGKRAPRSIPMHLLGWFLKRNSSCSTFLYFLSYLSDSCSFEAKFSFHLQIAFIIPVENSPSSLFLLYLTRKITLSIIVNVIHNVTQEQLGVTFHLRSPKHFKLWGISSLDQWVTLSLQLNRVRIKDMHNSRMREVK